MWEFFEVHGVNRSTLEMNSEAFLLTICNCAFQNSPICQQNVYSAKEPNNSMFPRPCIRWDVRSRSPFSLVTHLCMWLSAIQFSYWHFNPLRDEWDFLSTIAFHKYLKHYLYFQAYYGDTLENHLWSFQELCLNGHSVWILDNSEWMNTS